jgi:hypothetical protein
MNHATEIVESGLIDLKIHLSSISVDKIIGKQLSEQIGNSIFDNLCTNRENDKLENYKLPDGNSIVIPKNIDEIASNFYFESLNLCGNVKCSLESCDIDLRSYLRKNLILSGGGSFLNNFNELLRKKCNNEIIPISYPERFYLNWIGGSILTQLSSFEKQWVSISDYLENGPMVMM